MWATPPKYSRAFNPTRDDEPESTMPRPSYTRLDLRPDRAARASRSTALASLLMVWLWIGAQPVGAQLLLAEESGTPAFPVSSLRVDYSESSRAAQGKRPALDALLPLQVELHETEVGWAAPRDGDPTQVLEIGGPRSETFLLAPSGLALTLRALVAAINETGLHGVDVRPAPSDIDLETERDLRSEGQTTLAVVVTVGRVNRIRTVAIGDRIDSDWKIDNELHEGIRIHSPIQPLGAGEDESTDLIDRELLEDYLYRLNRHPGRRVEAALSPDEDPGDVVLDYRVAESKPWFAYAQVSDTGTKRTSQWQTRVGLVHRQLTNRDDIASIEYLNGGADVNGIRAKYEAPFFGPKRPDWMKRRTGDPAWIDWIPREKIPWWGIDRLRWNMDFSFGRFEAGQDSIRLIKEDVVVSEQVQLGGQLIYEAWQHKNFFVDVIGEGRMRRLRVNNKSAADPATGNEILFIPRAAIRGQRINAVSNLGLEVGGSGQVLDTDQDEREQLGRQGIDGRFALVDFSLGYSTYLEPVLNPSGFRDPKSRLSSTLAHELALGLRGQYAFDYRLVPQASQIIGGLYSVRGYKQSQAVGDSIFISSFEYRFHLPRALPIMREPLNVPLLGDFRATPQQVYGRPDWDLTFRAFVDVGRAIRNSNNQGSGDFEDDETLIGVGVGAEFTFRSNLRARVDWATPLTPTANNGDPNDPNRAVRFGDNSEVHLLFSILY
jgi:hypothetical protein